MGRPPKHDLSIWTVTDDWPRPVPVTEAEIEVFEQWLATCSMNYSVPAADASGVEIDVEICPPTDYL